MDRETDKWTSKFLKSQSRETCSDKLLNTCQSHGTQSAFRILASMLRSRVKAAAAERVNRQTAIVVAFGIQATADNGYGSSPHNI